MRARYRLHAGDAPTRCSARHRVAMLRLMAGGYPNLEIARAMFLVEAVIKN
ncbi:MAG: hypothetical protein H0W24_07845 [Lysobacter sp.]|nr:hypothetical protein [Lysobacter sp.]